MIGYLDIRTLFNDIGMFLCTFCKRCKQQVKEFAECQKALELSHQDLSTKKTQFSIQINQLNQEIKDLKDSLATETTQASTQIAKLNQEITDLKTEIDDLDKRFRIIANTDGRIWERPHNSDQKLPIFRPLESGAAKIIAVLNLKGGVGKTTLTTYIGAELHRRYNPNTPRTYTAR
ncbi:hypothetical protein TI05_17255 [Achromatium sp. WMS3]|nr:hypothetical protein TI05_17255 [Achromatium sp. WMS3]